MRTLNVNGAAAGLTETAIRRIAPPEHGERGDRAPDQQRRGDQHGLAHSRHEGALHQRAEQRDRQRPARLPARVEQAAGQPRLRGGQGIEQQERQ